METLRVLADLRLALLASVLLATAGCGGGGSSAAVGLGTVALVNQSDVGQAPLTVEQFFIAPVGVTDPGPDRLAAPVGPGGIVIIGPFPAGRYNAVAVLDTGQNVTYLDVVVVAGQPTNVVVPGP